jgi:hypothetical protein
VLTEVGLEGYQYQWEGKVVEKEGGEGQYKNCVHMYINAKMTFVETVSGMGG